MFLHLALFGDVSLCDLTHLLSLIAAHLGKFRMGISPCAVQKSVYGQLNNTELMCVDKNNKIINSKKRKGCYKRAKLLFLCQV